MTSRSGFWDGIAVGIVFSMIVDRLPTLEIPGRMGIAFNVLPFVLLFVWWFFLWRRVDR